MRKTTTKLYTCGTILWEIDPSNTGSMEFYASANAVRDDQPCTDQCGVLEYEVKLRCTVRRPKLDVGKMMTAEQFRFEERITVPLAEKLAAAALQETKDPYLALSALTRALATFKIARRKARRSARLKK